MHRRGCGLKHRCDGTNEAALLREVRILSLLWQLPVFDHNAPGNNPPWAGGDGPGHDPYRYLFGVPEPSGNEAHRPPDDLLGVGITLLDHPGDCGEGRKFPPLSAGFAHAGDPHPEDDPASGIPNRYTVARNGAVLPIVAPDTMPVAPRCIGRTPPSGEHRFHVVGVNPVLPSGVRERERPVAGITDPDRAGIRGFLIIAGRCG